VHEKITRVYIKDLGPHAETSDKNITHQCRWWTKSTSWSVDSGKETPGLKHDLTANKLDEDEQSTNSSGLMTSYLWSHRDVICMYVCMYVCLFHYS